jgi:hypothetical protein
MTTRQLMIAVAAVALVLGIGAAALRVLEQSWMSW